MYVHLCVYILGCDHSFTTQFSADSAREGFDTPRPRPSLVRPFIRVSICGCDHIFTAPCTGRKSTLHDLIESLVSTPLCVYTDASTSLPHTVSDLTLTTSHIRTSVFRRIHTGTVRFAHRTMDMASLPIQGSRLQYLIPDLVPDVGACP